MCGIAGVIKLDGAPLPPESETVLRNMAKAIAYRGPDDEQLFLDRFFGCAFRRLSIIDVAGGRQPLWNEDHSIMLIANGEIYNHQELKSTLRHRHHFQTESDCESILHLYEEKGIALLDDLIGMYAFAIWDRRQEKLILARDRLGIKPLFYSSNRDRLIFASEIKALWQYPDCPRRFDWDNALTDVWLSGDVATNLAPPSSYFQEIEQLPGGTFLEVDLRRGTVEQHRYWSLPTAEESQILVGKSEDELIAEYRNLLLDSVDKCLMSDVEVGIFLSGGIDSAAVSAISAQYQNLHTFSVLSQSTFTNEDAKYAHFTAQKLGLPNHQVLFRWEDNQYTPQEWKKLLWLCETPFCGPEQIYKYHLHRYVKATRPNLKVILTGQGSDEFNGGYSTILAPRTAQNWQGFAAVLELMERGRLFRTSPSPFTIWEQRFNRSLFSRQFLASLGQTSWYANPWSAYVATKYRDLQMYNCWHEDRTSSGNSIENRVPFLDHRLVELTAKVPADKWPSLFWDKRILRRAMGEYLPAEICDRTKVAFFYGTDARYTQRMMLALLRQDNDALIEEAFASGTAAEIFEQEEISQVVGDLSEDPEVKNIEFLLRLVNMSLLEQMAQTPVARETTSAIPLPRKLTVQDWDQAAAELGLELAQRRKELSPNSVPVLAANVSLLRRQDNSSSDEWYIVVDNQLQYLLRESKAGAWLRVLREIDGQKSLKQIYRQVGVMEAEVRKFLEEAIDFNLISHR